MQQHATRSENTRNIVLEVQMLLSYSIASGITLMLFQRLPSAHFTPGIVILLALAGGTITGCLTTTNIQYALFALNRSFTRLLEGKPLESNSLAWSWPLHALIASFTQIAAQIQRERIQKQLTDEYREQLLRQTRESAAAEERNRIARELHDSIKQQLFSIRMSALAARNHTVANKEEALEAIEAIEQSAGEAQIEMQALLQQLRFHALEQIDLAEALHIQARALEYRSGAHVAVEISELPVSERCPLPMQETLFRFIQEAFANIARHARAKQVACVVLSQQDSIVITIHDDGQGFDAAHAAKGMGLANMRERIANLNGTLSLASTPGQGTHIRARIPLLLTSEEVQQREQQRREVQNLEIRAQSALHLRATLSLFLFLVTAVTPGLALTYPSAEVRGIATAIVLFCLLLIIYGLISAHLAIARIRLFRGPEERSSRLLHAREHHAWNASLRLLLFTVWFIPLWQPYIHFQAPGRLPGLVFFCVEVLIAILLILEHRQAERAHARYYQQLAPKELARELQQSIRWVGLRTVLCLCLGLFLFAATHIRLFPPLTLGQWLALTGFFVLLIFLLEVLIDLRQFYHWRKRAKDTRESTVITWPGEEKA